MGGVSGVDDTVAADAELSVADTMTAGVDDAVAADAELSVADTMAASATADAKVDGGVARQEARRTDGPTTVLPTVQERDGRMVVLPRKEERYPREKVIGEGGMGVVELARDADIGREVAIKRLRSHGRKTANPVTLARFVEEVRTVGRLDHPGIAPIHDVGVDADGAYFFVMKYVQGTTLEDIIERLAAGDADTHAKYSIEARAALFTSLLHALDYAHSANILHRDLKPANVMLGPYGEVLLMDWGIARPIGGEPDSVDESATRGDESGDGRSRLVSTREGALLGTPLYMSPEQARGETSTLDARSDVYSAGMLLLELLTLRHPLEAQTTIPEICHALQAQPPPGIGNEIWDHPHQKPVPSELRHLIRRAIQPEADDRWQSVGEMLFELERIRSGQFRVQCPATFMKRFQRQSLAFVDKHPILANVGVATLLATFATSLVGFIYLWVTR